METYRDRAALRALAGFSEDQSVVPSAHCVVWLITACNSCTRASHTLFWSLKYLYTGGIYLYRYADIFLKKQVLKKVWHTPVHVTGRLHYYTSNPSSYLLSPK